MLNSLKKTDYGSVFSTILLISLWPRPKSFEKPTLSEPQVVSPEEEEEEDEDNSSCTSESDIVNV